MTCSSGIVTLLTDFGYRDSYVGAIKGKILSECARLAIADITHGIPPGDIEAGAFVLSQAAFCFPPSTVHCAVVDPGVGGSRAALVMESGGHFFVGPDNGLFSLVMRTDKRIYRVEKFLVEGPQTFHGRDLFGPVAAKLALGMQPEEVGPLHEQPIMLDRKRPVFCGDVLQGEVQYIDRFGNLITNLTEGDLETLGVHFGGDPGKLVLEIQGHRITGLSRTFSDRKEGEFVLYPGSAGKLEIGVREGSAARRLNMSRGGIVTCKKAGS